jgi:hypothetical protein
MGYPHPMQEADASEILRSHSGQLINAMSPDHRGNEDGKLPEETASISIAGAKVNEAT